MINTKNHAINLIDIIKIVSLLSRERKNLHTPRESFYIEFLV